MPRQIHRVMKESQDLNYLKTMIAARPEHHEMTPFATLASNVQGVHAAGDVVACLRTDHCRAGAQRL